MKLRHLARAAFALSITTAFAAEDESNLVLLDTVNPAIRDLAEIAEDFDVDPGTQQPTAQLVYDRLNQRNKIGVFFSEGFRSEDGYNHSCHLLKPQDMRSPNTWRVADFSSTDDSALFMMNHLPSDTRFLPLPLVDTTGDPWQWNIQFDSLSWTSLQAGRTYQDFQNYVDTSLGAGASAGKIQIYKRLEFPSELNYIPKGSGPFGGEKDYDTNRANFSDTAKKFVIVLHGWNTSPMRDPYADDDWKPFFNSLHTEMTNKSPFVDGWDLYAYRWGQDSYTGNLNGNGGVGSTLSLTNLGIDIDPQNTHGAGGVGVGVENGTQAAEIGYQHGLVLGKLIWEHCEKQKISPEKIHFVAHSAGTWVARSASLYLSKQYPLLDQQITLMDPYNPRAGHDEWDNLGDGFPKDVDDSELRTDTINAWVNAVNPLRAENIFSMDELVSGTNSYYGGGFVNQQVGSSSYGINGGKRDFGAHGGPVRYYTFSVKPAYYSESVDVAGGEEMVDIAIRWNNRIKQYIETVGWEKSMFMQECYDKYPRILTKSGYSCPIDAPQQNIARAYSSDAQFAPAAASSSSPWHQILLDVDSVGWVRAMLLPVVGGAPELAGPVRPEPDGTFSITLADGSVLSGEFDTTVVPAAVSLAIDGVPFGQKTSTSEGSNPHAGVDAVVLPDGKVVISLVLPDGTAGVVVRQNSENTGWEGAGVGTVDEQGNFNISGEDEFLASGQFGGDGSLVVETVSVTPPQVPEIHVTDADEAVLVSGVATKDFGVVDAGSASAGYAVTIRNTGTVPLTGLGLTVAGSHPDDFTTTGLTTDTLLPDEFVVISIDFRPQASGLRNASLEIASNDRDENPFVINLSGTGTDISTQSFTSTGAITIPGAADTESASPYPSTVTVSGITGYVTRLRLKINGLSHTFPDDINMYLVSPEGKVCAIMTNAGGGTDIQNIDLTFDDEAVDTLQATGEGTGITSGVYLPTNHQTTNLLPPGGIGSVGTSLLALTTGVVNGDWKLFVKDIFPSDDDGIIESWTLEFTVTPWESSDFIYDVYDGSVTITGYRGSGGEVTLPSIIEDLPVTRIDQSAFSGNEDLTSVTIPEGVTSIGYFAFAQCTSLTDITLPASLTSIEAQAFWGCENLLQVVIPASITSILEGTFQGCSSLSSVHIPYGVTSIGSNAFRACSSLTNVTLPVTVNLIESGAFASCSNLTEINIPHGVTQISSWAFADCEDLPSLTLPSSVSSIGEYAFRGCSSLAYLNIPANVTTIGDWAFGACSSLGSITIPSLVTSIGEGSFFSCTGLTSITIPSSVESIGELAFAYCSGLANVIFIGNAPTSVGDFAFDSLAAGAKAKVYAYYLNSFGSSGSVWHGLVLERVADPLPSVRFTSPGYNTVVWNSLVTRYAVTNTKWASRMEVMVRGRGSIRWISYWGVKNQHLLDRKIFNSPGGRLIDTYERARVRNKSGSIVQVATRKYRSKFPWNDKRAKISVLKRW